MINILTHTSQLGLSFCYPLRVLTCSKDKNANKLTPRTSLLANQKAVTQSYCFREILFHRNCDLLRLFPYSIGDKHIFDPNCILLVFLYLVSRTEIESSNREF